MRALLLMPLHESSEYIAMNLMVALRKRGFETLSVPSYANYLLTVELAKNFEASVVMALDTAEEWARENANCIVIGNCTKRIPFDVILNVNINHEEGEPIQDLQVAKLQELYGDDDTLGHIVNHLYSVKDGEYNAGGSVEQIADLVTNLCKSKSN